MTTLEQFSALVADIYDAALDPSLWGQTLHRRGSAPFTRSFVDWTGKCVIPAISFG